MPSHVIGTSVDILICTSIEDIQTTTHQYTFLQRLRLYITQGWPHSKDRVQQGTQNYQPIRHELLMIDSFAMKAKRIIIPSALYSQFSK